VTLSGMTETLTLREASPSLSPLARRKRRRNGPWRSGRLPAALERELVLAAQNGGAEERDQLIEAFLPLIASVARTYRNSAGIERNELMQEGVVGLLRALERFDPALGTPFWAYAAWWVRQAMQQLVSELSGPVVLSDRALRQLARIKEAERRYVQTHRREPSAAELAAETGLSPEQVESLIAAQRSARPLDEPAGGNEGAVTTLAEQVADPRAEDAYERVPRRLAAAQLPGMLAELGERERKIVHARFGLDGRERTLRELADDLGVSAERVRQIEGASLRKLQAAHDGSGALRPGAGGQSLTAVPFAGSVPEG
jgi:RNA polymerase primary sigma factor